MVKLPDLLKSNHQTGSKRVKLANTAQWHPGSVHPKIRMGVGMWQFQGNRVEVARLANPTCHGAAAVTRAWTWHCGMCARLGGEGRDSSSTSSGCEHCLLPSSILGFVPWGPCPCGDEAEFCINALKISAGSSLSSPKYQAVLACSELPP